MLEYSIGDGLGSDRVASFAGPMNHRILVADDNRDSAESMSVVLQMMGNEVLIVHDGVGAVEAAAQFRPDLILLDIGMPRMNGYEAARRIRDEPWGKQIVLVAVTGWSKAEEKQRADQAGFDHHFTKPVNIVELETLFGRMQSSRAAPVSAR
jgi:CheY-like chemotaxis protein